MYLFKQYSLCSCPLNPASFMPFLLYHPQLTYGHQGISEVLKQVQDDMMAWWVN